MTSPGPDAFVFELTNDESVVVATPKMVVGVDLIEVKLAILVLTVGGKQ